MKRILSILALTILTIGFAASCTKSDERIENLDSRLSALESGQFVSIAEQVAGLKTDISNLENIRKDIQDLIPVSAAQGRDITGLKAADDLLAGRIDDLRTYLDKDLKNYAASDVVAATYATLAQYNTVNEEIRRVDAEVASFDESVSNKIKDFTDSISSRVEKLEAAIIALTGRVDALENRVQGISIVPANRNGSVDARYGLLAVKCVISPASVLKNLGKEDFSILIGDAVTTRAGEIGSISIADDRYFQKDTLNGTVLIRADVTEFAPAEDKSLIVAVNVRNGISDCTSKFVKAEYTAPTVFQKLRLAEAEYRSDGDGAYWELKLEKGEDALTRSAVSTYPTFTVRTKSAYSNEFLEGDYEIESAVLYSGETETTEYTGGAMTVICTSSDGYYDFVGLAEDAEGNEYDFNPIDVKVGAGAAALKDKAAADPTRIPVSGISLNVDETTVELARDLRLIATVTPSEATNANVVWTSSDETVATVGIDGKVRGLATGAATITATTVDGKKKATCAVTVVTAAVRTITLNKESLDIYIGDVEQLMATVLPEDAPNREVTWASTDESVATVDETGKVTAVSVGSATIVAYTDGGGKSASCAVTVNPIHVTGISFEQSETGVDVGITKRLVPIIVPENATNRNVIWSISNSNFATIDQEGNVTGLTAGTAIVTATTEDGALTANCTVIVSAPHPLPGVFSVSATGKVRFSRGNLMAEIDEKGNPLAWKFHPHQWSLVGKHVANTTIGLLPGPVDLFRWSTDAQYSNYGIHTKSAATSGYTDGNFKDWSNALGSPGTWRTLTIEEWKYLSEERDGSQNKIGLGTVGGTKGVIFIPDEFVDPERNNSPHHLDKVFKPASSFAGGPAISSLNDQNFQYNFYSAEAWEAMEAAGAVFLPYNEGDSNGYYWSSSAGISNDSAYIVRFWEEIKDPFFQIASYYRWNAYNVRLVTDVNE